MMVVNTFPTPPLTLQLPDDVAICNIDAVTADAITKRVNNATTKYVACKYCLVHV